MWIESLPIHENLSLARKTAQGIIQIWLYHTFLRELLSFKAESIIMFQWDTFTESIKARIA